MAQSRVACAPHASQQTLTTTSQQTLATLSDEMLLEKVCGGSEPHFNQLYERYFQRLYSFTYSRVRNHADAEELTQETFTIVFQSAPAYCGRSRPLGWIYGIAKNTVYNHLRRTRTRGERLKEAGPGALQSADFRGSQGPEEQLALERFLRTLDDRLRLVSDWQAEVFFLRHVENLPIQEISRRTQRSSDAVRSGLYRVKRVLVGSATPGVGSATPVVEGPEHIERAGS